jgi:hypothetical protein
LKARVFASTISGRFANLRRMKSTVPSVGRPYSHDIRPSAKKFFERSASREVTPSIPFSASIVIAVSGIECTWYASSDPSSSGLAS